MKPPSRKRKITNRAKDLHMEEYSRWTLSERQRLLKALEKLVIWIFVYYPKIAYLGQWCFISFKVIHHLWRLHTYTRDPFTFASNAHISLSRSPSAAPLI